MKKKLLFAAAFILLAWSFDSCSVIDKCKFCKYVTYDNGSFVSETAETEYCGAKLVTQEAIPDFNSGTLSTKVECR